MRIDFLSFCASLFLFVVIYSCENNSKRNEAPVAPKGMRYVDISRSGMSLFVAAPDSTSGVLDTLFDSSSKVYLSVGKAFKLIVEENEMSIATKKEELKNTTSEIELVKSYVVDNDSCLLWETTIGEISKHHFYYVFKYGKRRISFTSPAEEIFSKQEAAQMLEACKLTTEKITN